MRKAASISKGGKERSSSLQPVSTFIRKTLNKC